MGILNVSPDGVLAGSEVVFQGINYVVLIQLTIKC